jgi:type IV pilus assembly protein PilC
MARLLNDIRTDVESGSGLAAAFRKHPVQFDALYSNLVGAGEQSGALDALLDRLATYKEKILAIKSKIKGALFYPIAVVSVAFGVVAVMMLFVIPQFKSVFTSFGAELPAPTLFVMGMSDIFIAYWWAIFGAIGGALYAFLESWKRSEKVQMAMDRLLLRQVARGEAELAGCREGPELAEKIGVSLEVLSILIEQAVEAGVFGGPFYIVRESDERFWGQDRLEFLDRHLATL